MTEQQIDNILINEDATSWFNQPAVNAAEFHDVLDQTAVSAVEFHDVLDALGVN